MSLKNEVELVMEYNITTKARINQSAWTPCATSTPVRKPLLTLSNSRLHQGFKQYEVLSRKSNKVILANNVDEVQNGQVKNIIKKHKNKSHKSFFSDDDDDDDDGSDDEKKKQTKKPLIIKLGSTQCINRSIKNNRSTINPVMKVVSPDYNRNSRKKDRVPTLVENYEKPMGKDMKNARRRISTGQKEKSLPEEIKDELKETAILVSPAKCSFKNEEDEPKLISIDDNPEVVGNIRKSTALKRKIQAATVKSVSKKLKEKHEISHKNQSSDTGHEKSDKVKKIKNSESTEKIIKNTSKLSISHEIFSDTKEQELRDSLDLTAVDGFEVPDDKDLPNNQSLTQAQVKQKNLIKLKTSHPKSKLKTVPISKGDVDNVSEKLKRPKRTKKSPKEFWLPRSQTGQSDEPPASVENNNSGSINELKDVIAVSSKSKASPTKSEEFGNQIVVDGKSQGNDAPHSDGFLKDLTQMEFTENCTGEGKEMFSVALGWQFSSFKCCVLKIGAKCEASGRTKHENSHFGGILLRGRLSMKIKENDIKMKAGQMFYVAPLTDWKAVNTGKSECVVYYWCGRF